MSRALPALPDAPTAQDILRAGLDAAGGPVGLACSFSAEDVVVLDLLRELGVQIPAQVRVFALDTGRLDEETYEAAEAVRVRYGIPLGWHFPERDAVEQLEREKGLYSFRESLENRHECCRIRKVEPLARALRGLAGWITGLRREQSVTRTALAPLEVDEAHGGILKINPLLDWTWEQVWAYAEERRLPVNRLHRQGYPSIGCAPCTRAVAPGEHPRAGRWWWESPEHKECGLHRR
ncbi:MAG: phosphoadenylyl-sulfate reductase [Thermodesulfobacteriota bacterium]